MSSVVEEKRSIVGAGGLVDGVVVREGGSSDGVFVRFGGLRRLDERYPISASSSICFLNATRSLGTPDPEPGRDPSLSIASVLWTPFRLTEAVPSLASKALASSVTTSCVLRVEACRCCSLIHFGTLGSSISPLYS